MQLSSPHNQQISLGFLIQAPAWTSDSGRGRFKLTISTSYRVTEPVFNKERILQKNVSEFSLAYRNWNHAAMEAEARRWSADRCWGLIISVRRDLGNPRIHEAANKVEVHIF